MAQKGEIMRLVNSGAFGSCMFCGKIVPHEHASWAPEAWNDEFSLEMAFCDPVCIASWERVHSQERPQPPERRNRQLHLRIVTSQ